LIPARYTHFVFAFFMAILVSCLVSLVITFSNLGLVDQFLPIWMRAWVFAFMVAFPSVVLAAPVVAKLVTWVVKRDEH
jgi:hypothetical protein